MLPRTRKAQNKTRKRKRELEAGIAVERISDYLLKNSSPEDRPLEILEFGSGSGFQIPYLEKLGKVTASDLYLSDELSRKTGLDFVNCSIAETPFPDKRFDLIFSNHVIEHIKDKTRAFDEMKRIGAESCLYAFSVPTNIWLLLSIPAQYYNKARWLSARMLSVFSRNNKETMNAFAEKSQTHGRRSLISLLLPTGHGFRESFCECYSDFKINSWKKLFSENGFCIVQIHPLLLYAPAEWPIIPLLRSRSSYFCSSILFILIKQHKEPISKLSVAARPAILDARPRRNGGHRQLMACTSYFVAPSAAPALPTRFTRSFETGSK